MKTLLLSFMMVALASTITLKGQTVTGTVTSADGPIPGVNISEKGTTNGVVTEIDGKYSINPSSPSASLIFSYIGFEPKEVRLGGRSVIDVLLEEDAKTLDEFIVTAYGTSKKGEFTGAYSVTTSEDLQKIVVTNITGALQGTVSGVQVNTTDGTPGANPQVRVRGISSINGDSNPLIVLNGAPFGGTLASIDPNDVESMTVLKDASATVLYGSRASGGVILITTKRGGAGEKPIINFKATTGVTDMAVGLHKRVNNAQYYEMRWEAGKNGYLDANPNATLTEAEAYATATLLPKLGNYNSFDRFPLLPNGKMDPAAQPRWGTTPNEMEKGVYRQGSRKEYALSLSGGNNEGLSYYTSMGYLNEKGVLSNQSFDRFNGRVDVSNKFSKIFEVGISTAFTRSLFEGPNSLVHHARQVLDMPDIYPLYQWDDTTNDWKVGPDRGRVFDLGAGAPWSYNGLSRATWAGSNPLQQIDENIFNRIHNNLSTRANISITPMSGLSFKSSIGVDYFNEDTKDYWSSKRGPNAPNGGRNTTTTFSNFVYTWTNLLSYNKSIGDDHTFGIMGGFEVYALKARELRSTADGFPVPTLTEIGAASRILGGNGIEDNHNIESYLSKLDYTYKGKYAISGSFRRDGTSRFAPESRWGNFGSVGVSWLLSREAFMDKTSSWLNDFSFRASVGSQGNERIGSYYAYLGTFNISSDQGSAAFQANTVTNRGLKWENNIQTNIGFSAKLISRVNVEFDYFIRDSKDLLFARDLPLSSGLQNVNENIADLRNKGFELQIYSYNLPSSSALSWETSFNLTHFTNEITSLPREEIAAGLFRYRKGASVYDYYLREWRGVNPANGNGTWTGAEGQPTENVNQATFDYQGSSLPDFFGNISNTFGYKGFDFSFNITYSIGGQLYDNRFFRLSHPGSRNIAETFAAEAYNYWTPSNPNTSMTRLTDFGAIGNTWIQPSTRYLVDATYARVRNITFGYTIPKGLTSRIGVANARVFLQADNMFTFFGMKSRGLDPEQPVSGALDAQLPVPNKVFQGGILITL